MLDGINVAVVVRKVGIPQGSAVVARGAETEGYLEPHVVDEWVSVADRTKKQEEKVNKEEKKKEK